MSLGLYLKKYFWIGLIIIYVAVVGYRVHLNGWKELGTLTTIAFTVAIIQLVYTNVGLIRKPFVFIFYWLFKIQFEWEFVINIKADEKSVKAVTQKEIRKWIGDILEKANLSDRKKDIKFSVITNGFMVYIPVFGLNLTINTYKNDHEFDDEDEETGRIAISGHALINYRQTRRVLISFMKVFFNKLESNFSFIKEKTYSLKVSSGEMDKNFYKDQFIKGFDEVDYFSITKEEDSYRVSVNKKYLEIISEYSSDIINNANKYLLQMK